MLNEVGKRFGVDGAVIEQTMTQKQIDLHFHWISRDSERRFTTDKAAIAQAIGMVFRGGSD